MKKIRIHWHGTVCGENIIEVEDNATIEDAIKKAEEVFFPIDVIEMPEDWHVDTEMTFDINEERED